MSCHGFDLASTNFLLGGVIDAGAIGAGYFFSLTKKPEVHTPYQLDLCILVTPLAGHHFWVAVR